MSAVDDDRLGEVHAQTAPFAMLPESVIFNPTLSSNAKVVYAALLRYAGTSRRAFPGQIKMGERCGLARSTAQRALDELRDCGLVEVKKRYRDDGSQASNDYLLPEPPPITDDQGGPTGEVGVPAGDAPRCPPVKRGVPAGDAPEGEPVEREPENDIGRTAATTPRKKSRTAPPDLLPITPAMSAWGQAHAPDVTDPAAETRKMLDHHRAKGSLMADWTAAWRTWMGNAQTFATERTVKAHDARFNLTAPDQDPRTEWKRMRS